jgi:hypothetical protein
MQIEDVQEHNTNGYQLTPAGGLGILTFKYFDFDI